MCTILDNPPAFNMVPNKNLQRCLSLKSLWYNVFNLKLSFRLLPKAGGSMLLAVEELESLMISDPTVSLTCIQFLQYIFIGPVAVKFPVGFSHLCRSFCFGFLHKVSYCWYFVFKSSKFCYLENCRVFLGSSLVLSPSV